MLPQRLLVVMPNWFGETLFATPLLKAIRHADPRVFVAALGVPRAQDILTHNPRVDLFIPCDERGRHKTLAAKWQLIGTLRANRFDAAIILRRSLTRAMLLASAGIPRRIGFANAKSGWLLTDRVPTPTAPLHKAHAYLRLLSPLGLQASDGSYEYRVSDAERASATALFRTHGVSGEQPIVILHPGANWAHKRWPTERFAQLADRLASARPLAIVVTGGPDDQPLAEAMRAQTAARLVVLAGQTTLRQLAACLEQASLVVSNDTGILHLATALDRPVVALYGPTSPVLTGPLGDPRRVIVIHHADCCPEIPCFHPDHPPHPGMHAIGVDEVYDAAKRLLGGGGCRVEGEQHADDAA